MPSFKKKMTISTHYKASIECSACGEVQSKGDLHLDEDSISTPGAARQALLQELSELGWRFSQRGDDAPLCADCYLEEAGEIEREAAAEEEEDDDEYDEYDEDDEPRLPED